MTKRFQLWANELGKKELELAGEFPDRAALLAELSKRATAHEEWIRDLECQQIFHRRVLGELQKLLEAHRTFKHEVRELPPPTRSRKGAAKGKDKR